jgi:peptidoglycan/LPS O-acetylase OafA/YrhL
MKVVIHVALPSAMAKLTADKYSNGSAPEIDHDTSAKLGEGSAIEHAEASGGCCAHGGAYDCAGNWKSLFARDQGSIGVLDGIRSLAVGWVLAFHSLLFMPALQVGKDPDWSSQTYTDLTRTWFMAPIQIGETGVDLFFLLSGFLISYLLGKEMRRFDSIGYLRFLSRRWLRIVPAYVAAILIYSVSTLVPCLYWGWTNLLFINNFVGPQVVQGVGHPNTPQAPCLGHSWSIAVEFQMYIVSPLLVWGMHRIGRWYWTIPLAVALASILLRLWLWAVTDDFVALQIVIYDKPYTRISPYLAGMFVAHIVGPAMDVVLASKRRRAAAPVTAKGGSVAVNGEAMTGSPPTHYISSKVHEIPGFRFAPVIYWVGVIAWVVLSFSKAPGFGQDVIDADGKAPIVGFMSATFRTFFGVAVGFTLFGMVIATLQDQQRTSTPIKEDLEAALIAHDDEEDTAEAEHGMVDPLACCGRPWAFGSWPGSARALAWFLEWNLWIPIARVSYSVYLLQFIPMYLLETVLSPETTDSMGWLWAKYMLLLAGTFLISCLLSMVIYLAVEKPCMNLRERCQTSRRAA